MAFDVRLCNETVQYAPGMFFRADTNGAYIGDIVFIKEPMATKKHGIVTENVRGFRGYLQ
jgi:hypothetical protein